MPVKARVPQGRVNLFNKDESVSSLSVALARSHAHPTPSPLRVTRVTNEQIDKETRSCTPVHLYTQRLYTQPLSPASIYVASSRVHPAARFSIFDLCPKRPGSRAWSNVKVGSSIIAQGVGERGRGRITATRSNKIASEIT